MARDRRWAGIFLGLLGLAYAYFILPRLYFRHDDWWILGNSVRYLPGDWGFLWRPTLYHDGAEIAWFFRPGFKLLVWAFYQVLEFRYAAWMLVLLVLMLATFWLGFMTINRITGQTRNGLWFILAAGSSVAIHFGSIAWMGEGMMNIPQAFLLVLSTYAFVEARLEKKRVWDVLSLAAFVVALGFKESSLFHLAFLGGLVSSQEELRGKGKRRWNMLIPFFAIGAVYLVFRLGFLPVNPSYLPHYSLGRVWRSLWVAVSPLLLPLAIWVLYLRVTHRTVLRDYLTRLSGCWRYLPFVVVSLSVYLGHDFFSPGWYLVVGFFWLFALALVPLPKAATSSEFLGFAALVFVFSALPVGMRLNSMGWWQWEQAQRGVFRALALASDRVEEIVVRTCEHPSYPGVRFERVITNDEGLRQIWFLTHGTTIKARLVDCETDIPRSPTQLVVDWRFPEVGRVIASP